VVGRGAVRHVEAELQTLVLVCRKCSKKLDGGFGTDKDERLAKVLRRELVSGKARKPRRARVAVLEVGCFDLCPKNAVVALRAEHPGDWVIVPKGTAVTEVLGHLGLDAPGQGSP
jgi:predicted metal-binding protein